MHSFWKCGKIWKNLSFFQAATARLGKYHTVGYCRIRVYSPVYHELHSIYIQCIGDGRMEELITFLWAQEAKWDLGYLN